MFKIVLVSSYLQVKIGTTAESKMSIKKAQNRRCTNFTVYYFSNISLMSFQEKYFFSQSIGCELCLPFVSLPPLLPLFSSKIPISHFIS